MIVPVTKVVGDFKVVCNKGYLAIGQDLTKLPDVEVVFEDEVTYYEHYWRKDK